MGLIIACWLGLRLAERTLGGASLKMEEVRFLEAGRRDDEGTTGGFKRNTVETEEKEGAQIQFLEMVGDSLITLILDAMNTAEMIHEEQSIICG